MASLIHIFAVKKKRNFFGNEGQLNVLLNKDIRTEHLEQKDTTWAEIVQLLL